MLIAASSAALLLAITLLALGVDPVPTWFYVFAWYPTLVLLDALAHRQDGRPLALSQPAALSMWLWSAPIWFFFEAANFRLDNWYYVLLPRNGAERWLGIVLSFATVVPALLLAERVLHAARVGLRWRTGPLAVTEAALRTSRILGAGQLVLALAWPRLFFPLVWGGLLLLCEPYVYRRYPKLSLYADLSRGEWGRVGRLLLGGAGIGLLWESFNHWARGKWIYTVPWLEELKLFEMPPFGFVGFPFFALEAWAMYHALCAFGVALSPTHLTAVRRRRLIPAAVAAATLSIVVLLGMERWTISSVVPRLADLPGTAAELAALRAGGITSPFRLAEQNGILVQRSTGIPARRAESLVALARLTTLRGIGIDNARRLRRLGLSDACTLAGEDPDRIWQSLHALLPQRAKRPTAAEVRVWHRAAEKGC